MTKQYGYSLLPCMYNGCACVVINYRMIACGIYNTFQVLIQGTLFGVHGTIPSSPSTPGDTHNPFAVRALRQGMLEPPDTNFTTKCGKYDNLNML